MDTFQYKSSFFRGNSPSFLYFQYKVQCKLAFMLQFAVPGLRGGVVAQRGETTEGGGGAAVGRDDRCVFREELEAKQLDFGELALRAGVAGGAGAGVGRRAGCLGAAVPRAWVRAGGSGGAWYCLWPPAIAQDSPWEILLRWRDGF